MIDSYSFGHIVIDGVSYNSDVIIFPKRVQSSWRRKDGHSLCEGDLETVFAFGPETLIVGIGKLGVMKVPKETRALIESKGIELLAMRTSAACNRFNDLASSKKVVGAFHLTC